MNHNPKTDHLTQYKWQKGVSGNKAGRPKAVDTILREMGYSKPVIAAMVAEIAFMRYHEVEEIADSANEPIIRTIIASAFKTARDYDGEYKYIEAYMKFLVGNPSPLPTNEKI